jgi:hypothetical protein
MFEKYKNSLIEYISERKFSLILVLLFLVFIKYQIANPDNLIINFYCLLFIYSIVLLYIAQILLRTRNTFVFYLIRSVFFICILFELLFGYIVQTKKNTEDHISQNGGDFFIDNQLIQYRFKPNSRAEKCVTLFGKDTLYNVSYSSDKYGRRINETMNLEDTSNTKAAILFGCSFAFGEGLNYNETIPYYLSTYNENVTSYNYGFSGYGPHIFPFFFPKYLNTLSSASIKEDTCVFIYTFIEDHLNRVYGNSNFLRYGANTSDIYVENNKLIIKKRSRINMFISKMISSSHTLSYFQISTSYPTKGEFFKRFASIINYTYLESLKIKPNSKFIVAVYPELDSKKSALGWIKFLNNRIKVSVVKHPMDFTVQNRNKYLIPHDGHPKGILNKYFVKEINKLITY